MKSKIAIVHSDYYQDISTSLVSGFKKSIDDSFQCDTYNVCLLYTSDAADE